jgi:WD40 repeat protein
VQQAGTTQACRPRVSVISETTHRPAAVAAGSLDRTIRLWDLTFGMPLSISRPHGGTVRAVALDHTLVASGGRQLSLTLLGQSGALLRMQRESPAYPLHHDSLA